MRAGGNMNVHRAMQMLSLLAMVIGFGLGFKLAQLRDYVRFPFFSPGGGVGGGGGSGGGLSGFGPGNIGGRDEVFLLGGCIYQTKTLSLT